MQHTKHIGRPATRCTKRHKQRGHIRHEASRAQHKPPKTDIATILSSHVLCWQRNVRYEGPALCKRQAPHGCPLTARGCVHACTTRRPHGHACAVCQLYDAAGQSSSACILDDARRHKGYTVIDGVAQALHAATPCHAMTMNRLRTS
jgi:hypothetical protein